MSTGDTRLSGQEQVAFNLDVRLTSFRGKYRREIPEQLQASGTAAVYPPTPDMPRTQARPHTFNHIVDAG